MNAFADQTCVGCNGTAELAEATPDEDQPEETVGWIILVEYYDAKSGIKIYRRIFKDDNKEQAEEYVRSALQDSLFMLCDDADAICQLHKPKSLKELAEFARLYMDLSISDEAGTYYSSEIVE